MILGISGRKQSGKTTTGNFIISLKLAKLQVCEKIELDSQGRIIVSDLFGDTNYAGVLDVSIRNNDYMLNKLYNLLDPIVKIYSFADPLKQDICMNIFGLTYEQCYGSDEAKNSLTDVSWENMPRYNISSASYNYPDNGFMTARQVMEFVGTEIFRKIKPTVWVDATINKIKKEQPKLAIIVDCRFPNEVDSIKNTGGKTIRLTRDPFNSNATAEMALDQQSYDWNNFDYICNNSDMSIYDQCINIQQFLEENLSL